MTTVESRTTLAINSVTNRKIRVNIVEDQALFRDLLRTALGGYGQIEVVSTAENGSDGIKNAYQYRPDAVIMDVDLGEGMTGIEAAQRIKSLRPEVGIVILSSHRDKEYLQSVAEGRGGGWSYLLKQNLQDTAALVRAIEGSTWGLVTLDPTIIELLRPRSSSMLEKLTERQMLVLKNVTGGYRTNEIARRVQMDEGKVDVEVERICSELGIGEGNQNDLRAQAAMTFIKETSTAQR
ncbi:MAG: response regulator transcription factor [Chloroflexi bacterium]|nr:response regulator transcription factor [Chloroflexota bacterium]